VILTKKVFNQTTTPAFDKSRSRRRRPFKVEKSVKPKKERGICISQIEKKITYEKSQQKKARFVLKKKEIRK